jgi:hypothetical protein
MSKQLIDNGTVQGDGGLREISGVFVINDLSQRVSNLESNQQETLPLVGNLVGKMESAFLTFSNIGDDIKEIKGDVKGVICSQNQMAIKLETFDSRVKSLEEKKADALQITEDRRKAARTAFFSVTATVIAAAIIWLFGLK